MRFTKMQGVGNDFVLVDGTGAPAGTDWAILAIRACARRVGVGADGLLVAERTGAGLDSASLSMRMFNPDGSEDVCGNGLRCVGLWAHRAGWAADARFQITTLAGVRSVELVDGGSTQGLLRVDMGVPRLRAADVPFIGEAARAVDDRVVNVPLVVDGDEWRITAVNTGSTHAIIFGPPPDEETFQRVSPQIEMHPSFPERTSVLWVTLMGRDTLTVRIWERGAGETWGCGTGACAVGVAAHLRGLTSGEAVNVVSKGGTLHISWAGDGHDVWMTGPAQVVFEGEMDA